MTALVAKYMPLKHATPTPQGAKRHGNLAAKFSENGEIATLSASGECRAMTKKTRRRAGAAQTPLATRSKWRYFISAYLTVIITKV